MIVATNLEPQRYERSRQLVENKGWPFSGGLESRHVIQNKHVNRSKAVNPLKENIVALFWRRQKYETMVLPAMTPQCPRSIGSERRRLARSTTTAELRALVVHEHIVGTNPDVYIRIAS